MLRKVISTSVVVLGLTALVPAYAEYDTSCVIEVAVSTPPVLLDQRVAFNVTSDVGFSKSMTLWGGSPSQFIQKIPCSPNPLTISATLYSESNQTFQGPVIGQCQLKAGVVILNTAESSVSVVFPYDFNCN